MSKSPKPPKKKIGLRIQRKKLLLPDQQIMPLSQALSNIVVYIAYALKDTHPEVLRMTMTALDRAGFDVEIMEIPLDQEPEADGSAKGKPITSK